MPDYQKGKIYKMVNTDNTLCYIGSTVQSLAQRRAKHVNSKKRWESGKSGKLMSFQILENDENACIVLIENYPCDSKELLLARERYYIDTMKCVNKILPGRTKKEYNLQCKESISAYNKEYRLENGDKIKEDKSKPHQCECGIICTNGHISRHKKSNKHNKLMEANKKANE